MIGLGVPELMIILVIILILFGVGRIGKIGKELGTGIRSFREGIGGEVANGHFHGQVAGSKAVYGKTEGAVHDQYAPAGSEPQAWLHGAADNADRSEFV